MKQPVMTLSPTEVAVIQYALNRGLFCAERQVEAGAANADYMVFKIQKAIDIFKGQRYETLPETAITVAA